MAAQLEAVFATRPAAHWVDWLADAGAAVGPVNEIGDLFDDARVRARGSIGALGELRAVRSPIRLLDAQGGERSEPLLRAPEQGEHTAAALAEAGFSAGEIAALRADGAL
jgi:crotonobetainyl-CoA:carnitine CoA-transferase CaiB-like acyl-CoA transferase